MRSFDELNELGLDLEPHRNTFTYTFPPPYLAMERGVRGVEVQSLSSWQDVSLYLHIPFCQMTCRFCSLHRIVPRVESEVDQYLQSLREEIRSWRDRLRSVAVVAVYIGGGTPTMLSSQMLSVLLDEIAEIFDLGPSPEVCIECAPDTTRTLQTWQAYFEDLTKRKRLPLTRVSIGLQTFEDETLHEMARRCDTSSAMDLLHAANGLVPLYNIDMIVGYPTKHAENSVHHEAELLVKGVQNLLENQLRVPSVSVYQLWDVSSIPATRHMDSARTNATEFLAAKLMLQQSLYHLGYGPSSGNTFIRNENAIHKWALHRCVAFRHIGMGSGVYSFFPNAFVQRPRDITGYIETVNRGDGMFSLDTHYALSSEEVELRRFVMGLRASTMVSLPSEVARNHPLIAEFCEKVDRLVDLGLVERLSDNVRLVSEAFILANEIAAFLHPTTMPRLRPTNITQLRKASR